MKKIGFIDYYLDEWHANNYPEMIRKASGGSMEVAYAYAHREPVYDELISNEKWSEKYGIPLIGSMEKLIEQSDYLIVLSPDNPEMHEELCKLPLMSGKRVYVDKTFAPDRAAAERIFNHAEKYGTPCYSSSALHFASEYTNLDRAGIQVLNSWGPGGFDTYSIHQLEPIVSILGSEAERVMFLGDEAYPSMIIEFSGGRRAQLAQFPGGSPFAMNIGYADGRTTALTVESPFFQNCIEQIVRFFETGDIPVPHEQTLTVIGLREAGLKAMQKPYQWIKLFA